MLFLFFKPYSGALNRSEKKMALNREIDEIIEDLKGKASDYRILGKDLLIVGGILVTGYALSRLLSGDESREETNETHIAEKPSAFSSAITGMATSVLLAIAKQKLMEYLQNLSEEDNE